MAFSVYKATLATAQHNDLTYQVSRGTFKDPSVNNAALVADAVAVAADVATLVADGASPTQAHVTTLNTDYTVLAADIASVGANLSGDLIILLNPSTVNTKDKFLSAIRALQKQIEGTY